MLPVMLQRWESIRELRRRAACDRSRCMWLWMLQGKCSVRLPPMYVRLHCVSITFMAKTLNQSNELHLLRLKRRLRKKCLIRPLSRLPMNKLPVEPSNSTKPAVAHKAATSKIGSRRNKSSIQQNNECAARYQSICERSPCAMPHFAKSTFQSSVSFKSRSLGMNNCWL